MRTTLRRSLPPESASVVLPFWERTLDITQRDPRLRHCDEIAEDASFPPCVARFINFARLPAAQKFNSLTLAPLPTPILYALYLGHEWPEYHGKKCRVVMASRFGDVGVRFNGMDIDHGYDTRCGVEELLAYTDNINEIIQSEKQYAQANKKD